MASLAASTHSLGMRGSGTGTPSGGPRSSYPPDNRLDYVGSTLFGRLAGFGVDLGQRTRRLGVDVQLLHVPRGGHVIRDLAHSVPIHYPEDVGVYNGYGAVPHVGDVDSLGHGGNRLVELFGRRLRVDVAFRGGVPITVRGSVRRCVLHPVRARFLPDFRVLGSYGPLPGARPSDPGGLLLSLSLLGGDSLVSFRWCGPGGRHAFGGRASTDKARDQRQQEETERPPHAVRGPLYLAPHTRYSPSLRHLRPLPNGPSCQEPYSDADNAVLALPHAPRFSLQKPSVPVPTSPPSSSQPASRTYRDCYRIKARQ